MCSNLCDTASAKSNKRILSSLRSSDEVLVLYLLPEGISFQCAIAGGKLPQVRLFTLHCDIKRIGPRFRSISPESADCECCRQRNRMRSSNLDQNIASGFSLKVHARRQVRESSELSE